MRALMRESLIVPSCPGLKIHHRSSHGFHCTSYLRLWLEEKNCLPTNCDPNTRLSDFIRDKAQLKGTKTTCREGGCGSCIVTVTRRCHMTGRMKTVTINSCLCPIHTMTDSHVTTVEGLGNHHDGFHPIQKNIAAFNGSQCGYCTPGMVMNTYGLFCNGKKSSDSQIEQSFDGNICRCTGYRPIIDAAKDLMKGTQHVMDIEDLNKFKCDHLRNSRGKMTQNVFNGKTWYSPQNLTELYDIFKKHKGQSTRLVFGNTASGIYQLPSHDVYISLIHVKELNCFQVNEASIEVGANTTLQHVITMFHNDDNLKNGHPKTPPGFQYLKHTLAPHLQKIGNLAIRNAGCVAGNLMLKHKDKMFPSDLFTPMEALDAKIKIGQNGDISTFSPVEFLDVDMTDKVIISVTIPALDPQTERFQAFKVMPRAANAYAYVNASFYVHLGKSGVDHKVLNARIAVGGISSSCHRARKTELLIKDRILNKETLKTAYACLEEELMCEENQVLPPGGYRKRVARNLLHLFLTNACNPEVSIEQFYENTSKKQWTSSTNYEFENKEDKYPYCQPTPKLDSCLQASGEAEFIDDKPHCVNELQAACVLSEFAKADVVNIDISEAENLHGVHAVITAKDLKGIQNKFPIGFYQDLVLLVEDHTECTGQPIAIVLAETVDIAREATKLVRVQYKNIQKPILTIEEAIEKGSFHEVPPPGTQYKVNRGDAETAYVNSDHQLTGEVNLGTQYHFYMENQIAYCIPYDDMLEVWLSTQTLTKTQQAIAKLLGMSLASINVKVIRVGGAFGGKVSNSVYVGSICALAAKIAKRPVRLALSLSECMKMTGKRFPAAAKYKVGVSADGRINAVLLDYYHDGGYTPETSCYPLSARTLTIMDNAYMIPHWKISGHVVKTDSVPSCAMRGPDEVPPSFFMESIMDHVATQIKKDPILIKEKHFLKAGDPNLKGSKYKGEVPLLKMWNALKENIKIDEKQSEVKVFNETNRFKKRGFSMIPTKMFIQYSKTHAYNAYVTVYSGDGTLAITHGAVEMGQGINTKVVQVAAKTLGVDVNNIKVHTTATLTAADSPGTYGSLGTECVCKSVLECCKQLKERMRPVQEQHPEASWKELAKKCYLAGIDMAVSYKFTSYEYAHGSYAYCVHGVCAFEAEVDVLTGENVIRSLDAIFDIGESANPTIDIGQIEGALVMGLGYFRSEKEVYDAETGVLLTDGTWDYKVPTAKDIPKKMNIKLLKNTRNELGVMPSKAVGEPGILSSPGVVFAIKNAIASYRGENGDTSYFPAKQPMSVDVIQKMCNVKEEDLLRDVESLF